MPQLDIIVIGAGPAGLGAAYFQARVGHRVVLLERKPELSTAGGGIACQPAAARVLQYFGLGKELDKIGTRSAGNETLDGYLLQTVRRQSTEQYYQYGVLRREVTRMLYDAAVEAGVDIRFGQAVDKLVDDSGSRPYAQINGQRLEADLIICADGSRSRSRPQILKDLDISTDVKIHASSYYVLSIPIAKLKELAPELVDHSLRNYLGMGGCLVAFNHYKTDEWLGSFAVEDGRYKPGISYETGADIEVIREAFSEYHPSIRRTMELADAAQIDRWQITEVPDLPRWHSANGRILLLGDAAHNLSPFIGHGMSSGIEDGGSLAHLLSPKFLTDVSQIPEHVKAWQSSRKARVEELKALSAYMTHNLLRFRSRTAPVPQRKMSPRIKDERASWWRSDEFDQWQFGFDALGAAETALSQAAASQQAVAHL